MMLLLGVTTLTASLTDMKPYLHLQLVPHMTTYHQVRLCSIRADPSSGGYWFIRWHLPILPNCFWQKYCCIVLEFTLKGKLYL
jgi:hypothetical protein